MTIRVLFVDDEEAMLRALKRNFSFEFDLTVAYSAKEATHLLQGQERFDVVVSDVSMPEMNGLEFIERVAPRNPHTRFIVLTGNCDTRTLDRARSMPEVCQLLQKPCPYDRILAAIEQAANLVAG